MDFLNILLGVVLGHIPSGDTNDHSNDTPWYSSIVGALVISACCIVFVLLVYFIARAAVLDQKDREAKKAKKDASQNEKKDGN